VRLLIAFESSLLLHPYSNLFQLCIFLVGMLAGLKKIVAAYPTPNDASPRKPEEQKPAISNMSSLKNAPQMVSSPQFSSDGWPIDAFDNQSIDSTRTPQNMERNRNNDRPATPSIGRNFVSAEDPIDNVEKTWATKDFDEWADMPMDDLPTRSNATIDVKPLPKLRLDLMPAPLEVDEDDISSKY
jgi:hypothetical protein